MCVKQGDLSVAETVFILPVGDRRAGPAGVRGSVVARKSRNGDGAKGTQEGGCVLEAERDEFLGRGRYASLDEQHDNYRNGYRRRVLNFFGLGKIELKVPRDRKGEFESAWLPERTAQDPETEAFLAEAFLAGLSTRDLARMSEKHLGQKYDSKQVSRIVARATGELEAWRQRPLAERRYKVLDIDGATFRGG